MYYMYSCPVCGTLFYTFNEHGEAASQTLYNGIEDHMRNYKEDDNDTDSLGHAGKEYQDLNTVYAGMTSSSTQPAGGFNLG